MSKQEVPQVKEHDSANSPGERRVSSRYFSCRTGRCLPFSSGGEEDWMMTVVDVSATGVALALSRRFERGVLLMVELSGNDGVPTRLLARVVRVEVNAGGGCLVGCTLLGPLDEEALRELP